MSSMGARTRLIPLDDQMTRLASQIFTHEGHPMTMLLLDERPQLDPGWIDSNISAIVEDFLSAQLDPGTKTKAQVEPTRAQVDAGNKTKAQLDPGFKTMAQLDPGSKTMA